MQRETAKAPDFASFTGRQRLPHMFEHRFNRQLDVPVTELRLLLNKRFDEF